ncbi:hypothetical protein Spb1_20460 [Planctopirus ephydatiae]|uniref:Uncharacterized protein n=1 Tax=Planctopirus ephydatiae TaxID=2528019 RepID=A0A518GNC7_9PLAN|nr:hypothetical protein [Planctopirus ephydatiae]QDV30118.1 hypothetical protein Spb1_20460 [Planctopirus ephydatiae]
MFCLNDGKPTEKTIDVETPQGTFQVTLRQPTFAEAMAYDSVWSQLSGDTTGATFARLVQMRLGLVTGWSGVTNAAGEPIRFASSRLEQLVLKSPEAFQQISRVTLELMAGIDPGESVAASVTGCGDVATPRPSIASPVSSARPDSGEPSASV